MWPWDKKKEESPKEEPPAPEDGPICSVCGQPGADRKFAGQWFHKKCLRNMRRQAKGMM